VQFRQKSKAICGLSSILRLRQHSIGYMGDGFYRSKDATNSIKVLKVHIVHRQIKHTISRHEHKTRTTNWCRPALLRRGTWSSQYNTESNRNMPTTTIIHCGFITKIS